MSEAYKNTDRVLFVEPNKNWKDEGYMPKVFVTQDNRIGFNVGGMVFTKTITEWVEIAKYYSGDLHHRNVVAESE